MLKRIQRRKMLLRRKEEKTMITPEQQRQLDHIAKLNKDSVRVILLPGHDVATPHTHVALHSGRAAQLIANGHAQLDEATFHSAEKLVELEARIAKLEAAAEKVPALEARLAALETAAKQ
jgi:hypothetical protein